MARFIGFNKGRIITTILLSLISVYIVLILSTTCPLISKYCPATSSTPNALQLDLFNDEDYEFVTYAKRVPFTCYQACTESEYYQHVTLNILFKVFPTILISYLLSCLIFFLIDRRKR